MCGIFGVLMDRGVTLQNGDVEKVVRDLLRFSETRGQEASGVATYDSRAIEIRKRALPGRRFVQSDEWRDIFSKLHRDENDPLICIGHARLDTNSSKELEDENSPMRCGDVVGVHNGIIVNVDDVWAKYQGRVTRTKEVDSELPFTLIDHLTSNGSADYKKATAEVFGELEGSASIAALSCRHPAFVMATNTGSLFVADFPGKALLFASEPLILEKVISRNKLTELWGESSEFQLRPGNGCYVDLENFKPEKFELIPATATAETREERETRCQFIASIPTDEESDAPPLPDPVGGPWEMRYCTKCILPETFPLIYFDGDGVCNYCNSHETFPLQGKEALLRKLEPVRSKSGEPDCVLGFSGGRDSSYGLHYFKHELGMNPVAFTYDWGVITDLARRNQARIVGALGIEHVIVAADIDKKRRNIRQNVEAWLKRPELGMVTLFMAGDKQAEWYVQETADKYNAQQIWMCRGNQLENEEFKWGYCGGIKEGSPGGVIHDLSSKGKFQILSYFFLNYLKNPRYFNHSFLDTAFAYFVTYLKDHSHFNYLWHYVPWEEREIVDTLITEYGWETDPGFKQSWRVDDGTTPFYNLIYYSMGGFTENDTFRSNQIREGILTRDAAWKLAWEENKVRMDTMQWYFDGIGVDMEYAMRVVKEQPRRLDLLRKKRGRK